MEKWLALEIDVTVFMAALTVTWLTHLPTNVQTPTYFHTFVIGEHAIQLDSDTNTQTVSQQ